MKKIVLLVALAFLGTTVVSAQDKVVAKTTTKTEVKTTKKKSRKHTAKVVAPVAAVEVKKEAMQQIEGAGMVFENETIDYGTIAHNSEPNRQFVFTNNGNKPLIITATAGSCGCTVPTKPEGEIAPGAKGVIGVKYATDRVGPFEKTVTVTSNAEGMPTKVIRIKGTVLPDPAPATPATELPKS
ncbi:MAG: DUF1573 domain-containing protein [Bacteroidota bacterium]